MNLKLTPFVLLLSVLSCTFALKPTQTHPDKLDPQSAIEAHDVTGLIEGCGVPITTGFFVCRKTEGDLAGDFLTFVAPPVHCEGKEPCVTFKIFFLDGSPALGSSIPKGKTRVEIPWSQILKRDHFELSDRGFWGFSYEIRYVLNDGIERTTYAQGDIYLRVLKKGYIPLHLTNEDSHFLWEWKEGNQTLKSTTGMRTFVGTP